MRRQADIPAEHATSEAAGWREDGIPWVGSSVPRVEDPRLVQGGGRYLEDLRIAGALEVAFVRSSFANARIVAVHLHDAVTADGVAAVHLAADLGPVNGPVPVIWQLPGLSIPDYPLLADGRVSYVGQPIAAVIASSRELAEDAAERIEVEYEELPAVTNARAALEPSAPAVHSQLGTNQAYHSHVKSEGVDELFAAAQVVVEADLSIHRHTAVPLQRRAVLARPDVADGRMTVWATVQHPHLLRDHLVELFAIPSDHLRVIAPDMGGAFGVYYDVYPEDLFVVWAARRLGRPVLFIEDRTEAFVSTVHAREQHHRAAIALTPEGRVLALRDEMVTDIGAFVDYSGVGPSYYTSTYLTGPYDIAAVDISLRCAFTNKVRSGGYRGFGQPQATFVLERLLDLAAERLGQDPLELRRRNLLTADRFPHQIATGPVMDSGDFPGVLDTMITGANLPELRRQQDLARAEGRLVGIGVVMYTEATGTGASKGMASRGYMTGGWEGVTVRVGQDGAVTVFSGASHMGQGIRTAIAQLCADEFGMNPREITVVTGDTEQVRFGNRGSIGSRSAVVAGPAVRQASAEVAARIRDVASELLEVDSTDLELRDGRVSVRGSASHGLSLGQVSLEVARRHRLSADTYPVLEAISVYEPPPGIAPFGSGAHLAMVEVDPSTGGVAILRYVIVHDCGTVINPALVEGQVRGGAAQGIGGALYEELVYDDNGQLRTSSMMDYLLPTASEIPDIEVLHQETPSPFHPLGVKGCGEAGTVGTYAALAAAVSDAVGEQLTELPLSPERVWTAALSGARRRAAAVSQRT